MILHFEPWCFCVLLVVSLRLSHSKRARIMPPVGFEGLAHGDDVGGDVGCLARIEQ